LTREARVFGEAKKPIEINPTQRGAVKRLKTGKTCAKEFFVLEECRALTKNPRPTPGLMKGLNVRREAGARHLQHRALRQRGRCRTDGYRLQRDYFVPPVGLRQIVGSIPRSGISSTNPLNHLAKV
jgi:hypothetical protein